MNILLTTLLALTPSTVALERMISVEEYNSRCFGWASISSMTVEVRAKHLQLSRGNEDSTYQLGYATGYAEAKAEIEKLKYEDAGALLYKEAKCSELIKE